MDATSIMLDGNNFTGTLESQAFIGRKRFLTPYNIITFPKIDCLGNNKNYAKVKPYTKKLLVG